MLRRLSPAAVVVSLAAIVFAQDVPNRVANPGFEQVRAEAPSGWVLTGSAGLDNAQFYAGAMGLKLASTTAETSTARQQVICGEAQFVALTWVRLERVAAGGTPDVPGVRLRILGETGQAVAESQPLTGDVAWQRLVLPFNPGNNGTVTVELSLSGTGAAWFDDVVVTDTTSAKPLLETAIQAPQRENLALGRTYELSPPANYEYCTDPDDIRQLTDGQYTAGYFWTQKSTVGWYTYSPQITIDLGSVQPILGVMANCPGGGAAGVQFPGTVTYLVSDDNDRFREVARLTPKGLKQDGKTWYTHRFLADGLRTRGRYVMARLDAVGSTVFTDEIEVYRGEFDPATVELRGPSHSRVEMAFAQFALTPTTYTRGHFPETPHVKWAIPLASGPIKSIVLCFSDDMREACELVQRLDLDYVPVSHYSYYSRNTLPALMQEQIERALPTAMVMVVGGFPWEAMPPALLAKVKARVREGMGLVVVSSVPTHNHAIEDMLAEAPLSGDQGLLDMIPIALAPAYHKPEASHFALATYGTGRVALVDTARYLKASHSLMPLWGLEALDTDANTPTEYHWAALSKVILWAAQAGERKLAAIAATPETIRVQVAPLTEAAKLQVVIRDSFSDPITTETREVLPAGGTLEIPAPAGANGSHPVDVWLKDGAGRVLDFGSTSYVTDNGARLEGLALDREVYAPRQPLEVTVRLSGQVQGTSLRTSLVDTFGRAIAAPQTVPVTGEVMRLTISVSEPLTLAADFLVSLMRGERLIEKRLERVWLGRPDSGDYTFMAWYAWDPQPIAYHGNALLRSLGLDGFVALPAPWRAPSAAHGNLRFGPENVSRVVPAGAGNGRVRVPCLTDPSFRSATAARIEALAQEARPYGVTEWSMGDESTLGEVDYCTSPTCLAAFRERLRQQYDTLEALNSGWGASFGSWDEVMPVALKDVEGQPNIAAWLDHRRYMEGLFAEYHDWCRGLVTTHIPAARVGISGTPNVNSYSGHDWWKLMQGPLTHLSSYGGSQRHLQRSFARPEGFVSTFLGYDYWDGNEQSARYGPWDLLFHGSNGVNYYTLMSDTLNCPLLRPDMTMTNKAPWTFEEVSQLKAGFGRLFMSARYVSDGIAIHYSPASVHAATAMGLFDNRDRLRRFDNNLENLGMILSQLHLQFDFIHEEQMARGELSRYRVLVLPWSSAVSPPEAAAIQEFVRLGGTVIADSYCGVRDAHGRPQAMLDDLFGVRQSLKPPALEAASMAMGPEFAQAGGPRGLTSIPVASGSSEVQLAGGQAWASCGGRPAVIVSRVGKGWAIFLNVSLSNYAEVSSGGVAGETQETDVAPETVTAPIRQFVGGLLSLCGIRAPVEVTCDGNLDTQVELSRLTSGEVQLLGLVRSIVGGAIDRHDLLDCRLSIPKAAYVYESRSGRALGKVSQFTDRLPRGVARVYALLPYPVKRVTVSGPATVRAGQSLPLELAVVAPAGTTPETHVLCLALTGPDGRERPWYARNIVAKAGRVSVEVALAFNDQPGKWKVTVTDMATQVRGARVVTVR